MPIVDAVTAVLFHQGEILMVERQRELVSFPGYHVFPGGKVDLDDVDHVYAAGTHFDQEPRLFRALMRELQEEIGVDWRFESADGGRGHCIEQCALMGTILTPPGAPRRFDTRFFRLDLGERPEIRVDTRELVGGSWASPQTWLKRYEAGELLLAPPTRAVLKALAADPAARTLSFGNLTQSDGGGIPVMEMQGGVKILLVRSNTVPPAEHTNCFLIGDAGAPRLLIDPSPNSLDELDRLQQTAGRLGFDEIFITHHHPDHQQLADELARRCGVPVGMSADTQQRIRRRAPGFFDGLRLKTHADGETVTRWQGQPVRVMAVPGHDEGQLALMPDNRAWCIVGDLIQGVGTVVISAPEGDMRKYFATLEKVIAAAPRAIYPSHGMPLGGVHYLEQTLRHRRQRETQVRQMLAEGESIDGMLAKIYRGVDAALLPLARRNIESHIDKLRAEADSAV